MKINNQCFHQIKKRKLFKKIKMKKVQKSIINQLKVYVKQIKKIKLKLNNNKKKLVSNKIYRFPMTKDLSRQHQLNRHLLYMKELKFYQLQVIQKYFWKME